MLPTKLKQKLAARLASDNLRVLGLRSDTVDFSSNDYLGFSASKTIFQLTHQYLMEQGYSQNGATGSRLLSGNHPLYTIVETQLAEYHQAEQALLFNSGYDANLGFFSSVPQRGDVILYDEFCHASIRDGLQLSNAKAYKFRHNCMVDLQQKLEKFQQTDTVYVVSESVFSMDGDQPDIITLSRLCKEYNAFLVIDEAHAVGVLGQQGCGLVQNESLQDMVFARIVTFGKALGCHGAAILGSTELTSYLTNFARSFIYTTALSPHALATIKTAYDALASTKRIHQLTNNINFFRSHINTNRLQEHFMVSDTAIQSCIIPGNENVKQYSRLLKEHGFDVKAILSPTVPVGEERLRFCIHSFNTKEEMAEVLQLLAIFVLSKQLLKIRF